MYDLRNKFLVKFYYGLICYTLLWVQQNLRNDLKCVLMSRALSDIWTGKTSSRAGPKVSMSGRTGRSGSLGTSVIFSGGFAIYDPGYEQESLLLKLNKVYSKRAFNLDNHQLPPGRELPRIGEARVRYPSRTILAFKATTGHCFFMKLCTLDYCLYTLIFLE